MNTAICIQNKNKEYSSDALTNLIAQIYLRQKYHQILFIYKN